MIKDICVFIVTQEVGRWQQRGFIIYVYIYILYYYSYYTGNMKQVHLVSSALQHGYTHFHVYCMCLHLHSDSH